MNLGFIKVLIQIFLLKAGCCAVYQLFSGDLMLSSSVKCHLENRAFPLRE